LLILKVVNALGQGVTDTAHQVQAQAQPHVDEIKHSMNNIDQLSLPGTFRKEISNLLNVNYYLRKISVTASLSA
jgi:hypothetical protein